MKIRIITDELIKYPDELGALAMADVNKPAVPPFSPDEVNLFVNGILGMLYDNALTREENIVHAKAYCTTWGTPDGGAMEKGFMQIKDYNEKIPAEQVGYSNQELIDLYYLDRPTHITVPYTIEQNMPETRPARLPKKLPQRQAPCKE